MGEVVPSVHENCREMQLEGSTTQQADWTTPVSLPAINVFVCVLVCESVVCVCMSKCVCVCLCLFFCFFCFLFFVVVVFCILA